MDGGKNSNLFQKELIFERIFVRTDFNIDPIIRSSGWTSTGWSWSCTGTERYIDKQTIKTKIQNRDFLCASDMCYN